MEYLIIPYDINLDTIISMYLYYNFIKNADFTVKCYIDNSNLLEVEKIIKEKNIVFEYTNVINKDSSIIILSNKKIYSLDNIDNNMVTEIITLENNDFTRFIDANILISDTKLLSTIMIERYREYKLGFSNEMCFLLIQLYDSYVNLTERDKIAIDYIKTIYNSSL